MQNLVILVSLLGSIASALSIRVQGSENSFAAIGKGVSNIIEVPKSMVKS